ncbi:hypothetical protein QP185_17630 [Sphingomonas aerolata]|uniref:hypothetical protein n=1 Tax=Sphingomonas aerolata TaxID=185951 RepID=UPI002FDFFFB5
MAIAASDALEIFDADGGPAWYLEFAEDAKGDQWSHESRFAFDGPKYRASFGWNAFFENGSQRVPFSTEEGTYIACSIATAYQQFRTALNGAGSRPAGLCRRQRHDPGGDPRHRDPHRRPFDADRLFVRVHQLRQQRHLFGVRRCDLYPDPGARADRRRTHPDRGSSVGLFVDPAQSRRFSPRWASAPACSGPRTPMA